MSDSPPRFKMSWNWDDFSPFGLVKPWWHLWLSWAWCLGSSYSVSDKSLSSLCLLDPLWIPEMLGITDPWVSLICLTHENFGIIYSFNFCTPCKNFKGCAHLCSQICPNIPLISVQIAASRLIFYRTFATFCQRYNRWKEWKYYPFTLSLSPSQ